MKLVKTLTKIVLQYQLTVIVRPYKYQRTPKKVFVLLCGVQCNGTSHIQLHTSN